MEFPDRNLCLNGIKAVVQINKSQEIQCYPLSRLLYHFFPMRSVPMGSPPFEFPGSGKSNPQVSMNYRNLGLPFSGTICPEDTGLLAKAFRQNRTIRLGVASWVLFFSLRFMGSCLLPRTSRSLTLIDLV